MSVNFVEVPLTYEIFRLSGFSGAAAEQEIEPHRDAEHRGRRDAADNQK